MNKHKVTASGVSIKTYDVSAQRLMKNSNRCLRALYMLYAPRFKKKSDLSQKIVEKRINDLMAGLENEWAGLSSNFEYEYQFDEIDNIKKEIEPLEKNIDLTHALGTAQYLKLIEKYDQYALFVGGIIATRDKQYMDSFHLDEREYDKGVNDEALHAFKLKYFKSIRALDKLVMEQIVIKRTE